MTNTEFSSDNISSLKNDENTKQQLYKNNGKQNNNKSWNKHPRQQDPEECVSPVTYVI